MAEGTAITEFRGREPILDPLKTNVFYVKVEGTEVN